MIEYYFELLIYVDIEAVLSFPLIPVPLCLGQSDGTMNKTAKATLIYVLEQRVTTQQPRKIDVHKVDGFIYYHLLSDLPLTFGNLARQILSRNTFFSAFFS